MKDVATNMPSGSEEAPVAAAQKSSVAKVAGIVVLALAVCGAAAAWLLLRRDSPADPTVTNESSSAPKYVAHLEEFTVNLADTEANHFLRTTIDLGVDRPSESSQKEKPTSEVPVSRIRDAILTVLTSYKADDLLTAEGKARLKKDLLAALNRDVPELGAREIYFTEFLVQR